MCNEIEPVSNFKDLYCFQNVYEFLDEFESILKQAVEDDDEPMKPKNMLELFYATLRNHSLTKY